jgi:endoglycosylceramidase
MERMARALRATLALLGLAATAAAAAAAVGCSKSSSDEAPKLDGSGSTTLDAGPCTSPPFTGSPLGVQCNALVDTSGRTVLLHGLNARVAGIFDDTFTDGRLPLMSLVSFTSADAARIRALGFNALRLPVSWSGIEPTEDGGVVPSYFDAVAAVTSACGAAGLLVLLDLHQDAYSKEIGQDGAPLWAISPPPTQLLGGPLTDLTARFESPQVQDAYATFFGDPTTGAYLRTRFAQMAAELAARFANDPAVLGFETYNEPLATDPQLLAFNTQVIPAIRAAAPTKLIFFEPDSVRDETGEASLGNGSLGAGTVYAPHVYTLAFTDPDEPGVTENTYAASNLNALDEAQSWQAPLVITEYGYPPTSPNFVHWAAWQADLEDKVLASSFFWLWKEVGVGSGSWGFYDIDDAGTQTERASVVAAMTRPRLEAAAGQLTGVSYDTTLQALTVTFNGSAAVTAPNVVSIGAGATVPAAQWTATCDGESVATGGADPLSIPCAGPGGHTLVVSAK